MKSRINIRAFAVFAALAVVFSGASVTYAASAAPLGFQLLCLQNPAQCQGGGASIIGLTQPVLATITTTNSRVNRAITPRVEVKTDRWVVGATSGDCEDYVLTKRQVLIEQGLPPSALRIAHVRTRKGEDHAILVVKTDAGDLTLDNLRSEVVLLGQTGYQLLAISGANPMDWSR